MSTLEASNVSAGYGDRQVLHDVSFRAQSGQLLLVIGANGSGKSTLLRTIFGLLRPWGQSRIVFQDQNVAGIPSFELQKRGMIYLPQSHELFDSMTVKENLELSCMAIRNRSETAAALDKVLISLPSLAGLTHRRCTHLSGGERKTVSLGMALMNDPDFILFDEPIAGVSPGATLSMIDHLDALKAKGVGLVIVEHRVRELFDRADRVMGMRMGSVYQHPIRTLNDTKEVFL